MYFSLSYLIWWIHLNHPKLLCFLFMLNHRNYPNSTTYTYYLETSHYPSSYHHEIIRKRSTEQNYLWTSLYVKSSTFVIISIPVYSWTLSDNVSILHNYPKMWKHIMMSHLLTYKNRHCGGIPSPRYRVRYSSSSRRYWSIPNVWKVGSRQ